MRKIAFKIFLFFNFLLFANCGIFTDPDRGVTPYSKFLSVLFSDRSPATVTSVLPKDKSTGNFINTNLFVVFNKTVSGFNTTNFTVSSDGGTTNHPGTVSISDKVVTFTPSINFNSNATYKVTLKAGSSLSTDYSFTFSTGNLSDTTPPSISSTNPPSWRWSTCRIVASFRSRGAPKCSPVGFRDTMLRQWQNAFCLHGW